MAHAPRPPPVPYEACGASSTHLRSHSTFRVIRSR